ncbi:MAG: Ribulose-phosphate 3-epimerase [Chloroflexi bacterium]|nr:Ribulose-phosphate 3-epimerase [Chloroflexota bacterium]
MASPRRRRPHSPVPELQLGRARVAVSILDADLGNLAYAIRRAEKEGADRIHLDVMDGHFVPNLTFGARTVKALRKRTRLPLDAHLMISEPSRYIDQFLDAGCDSVTIHVEIEEPIEPTLRAIRAAGRAAGLSLRPGTPLSALEPYRLLLDVIMVMTVEPGFGGQAFMADVARAKVLAARELLRHKLHGGEVHVDGGVNRETAEFVGALAADVLVAGSAVWIKGRNMGREIRLIRALADEGYQFGLNDGQRPIPRDKVVTFATLPRHHARTLQGAIEKVGIPVLIFRAGGLDIELPDEIRDWDVLLPASSESAALERFGARRDEMLRDAVAWRAAGTPPVAYVAAPIPPRPDEVVS